MHGKVSFICFFQFSLFYLSINSFTFFHSYIQWVFIICISHFSLCFFIHFLIHVFIHSVPDLLLLFCFIIIIIIYFIFFIAGRASNSCSYTFIFSLWFWSSGWPKQNNICILKIVLLFARAAKGFPPSCSWAAFSMGSWMSVYILRSAL